MELSSDLKVLGVRYEYRMHSGAWAVFRNTSYRRPDGGVFQLGTKVADNLTFDQARKKAHRMNKGLRATSDKLRATSDE